MSNPIENQNITKPQLILITPSMELENSNSLINDIKNDLRQEQFINTVSLTGMDLPFPDEFLTKEAFKFLKQKQEAPLSIKSQAHQYFSKLYKTTNHAKFLALAETENAISGIISGLLTSHKNDENDIAIIHFGAKPLNHYTNEDPQLSQLSFTHLNVGLDEEIEDVWKQIKTFLLENKNKSFYISLSLNTLDKSYATTIDSLEQSNWAPHQCCEFMRKIANDGKLIGIGFHGLSLTTAMNKNSALVPEPYATTLSAQFIASVALEVLS